MAQTTTEEDLWKAADTGDVVKVKEILTYHPELIDIANSRGRTSLFLAAHNGHLQVVELLIQMGSQAVNTPDNITRTPIRSAAALGYDSVVEVLARFGGKIPDIELSAQALFYLIQWNNKYPISRTLVALGATKVGPYGSKKMLEFVKDEVDEVDEDHASEVRYRVYFTYSLTSRLLFHLECRNPSSIKLIS